MATDSHDTRPPNPLERFTAGGWRRGLLRLALGAAIVTAVLLWTGDEVWALVLDRRVIPPLFGGALVYGLQRVARVRKWAAMIEPAGLVPRPWLYLLRVQLIGMVANLVLPISEALKIWAVSRSRRDVLVASESIAADLALHTACIGLFGVLGIVAGLASGSDPTPRLELIAGAAGILVGPLLVLLMLRGWPRAERPRLNLLAPRVLALTALETACQVGVYLLALHAIDAPVGGWSLLALAPLLYLADLFMLTPSGLGLREALFAVVFEGLTSSAPEGGVAIALVTSMIVLLTTALGGALALLLPEESGREREDRSHSGAQDRS